MILDYTFTKSKNNLSISYIKDDGMKSVLNFNVQRFKTYYRSPNGQFQNWDGDRCDIKYTDKPCNFDIMEYLKELPEKYQSLLQGKTSPKLYTFDIETETFGDEFPEPSEARFPITTISIASPDCNVIVLGTRDMDDNEYLQHEFEKYIGSSEFFKDTGLKMPTIKYIKFGSEHDMLEYFLRNIVSKVPIIAGWNSILFDWQYITNRIKGYYPDISMYSSSYSRLMYPKSFTDMKGNKVLLYMPNHTLVLDMMDVIGTFDMVVMPIKENLSLDYISYESIGLHKIEYKGDLQQLYETDYPKYVFYNAIDSVLVQLIDKKFKTMQNIYVQALYCNEKIGSCFSKIALAEALVFKDFYEHGIKIVNDYVAPERGRLVGAYVKKPMPGKHKWLCCEDFASLYPVQICTCNLSFENYVGAAWDEAKLEIYKADPKHYVVVGPYVFENDGTIAKPELGKQLYVFLDEEKLAPYRADKNYFVSVTGCIFKNDKDYAFKRIQSTLRGNRNVAKYLSKQLDAEIMTDVDHIIKKMIPSCTIYKQNLIDAMKNIGWNITCAEDIKKLTDEEIHKFKRELAAEIVYLSSFEQAMKLLGNSMYGGSSHVSFFWFNINLALSITSEGRNVIHLMEHHLPQWFEDNWVNNKELHKKLGIRLKKDIKNV